MNSVLDGLRRLLKMKKDKGPVAAFKFIYAVNFIMQAGFSMVCPAGLIILGGWLLNTRCGVGSWVMTVSIVLGVLVGVYSMFYYIVKMTRAIDPTHSGKESGVQNGRTYGNPGEREEKRADRDTGASTGEQT